MTTAYLTDADGYQKSATRYDDALLVVPGLTWLPWVGQGFVERPLKKRLLVAGESHYYRGDTPEKREAERKAYLTNPQSTRDVVSESLINQDWTTRTLTNIPKLLFQATAIDRPRLWADSAYYNFVQRPMDHNQGGQPERPTEDDFVAGWRVFAEVVRIIQPSQCLFIGVEAAKTFNDSMTRQKVPFEQVSFDPPLGGVCPRVAGLEIAAAATKLVFVHHLGRCKVLSQWHDYLQAHHTGFMNWLEAESYETEHST